MPRKDEEASEVDRPKTNTRLVTEALGPSSTCRARADARPEDGAPPPAYLRAPLLKAPMTGLIGRVFAG